MSESQQEMKIDPSRAQVLASQINSVKERLAAVANGRNVRLVAVSKLKPANDILALHQTPTSHTHFGENYAQELVQKRLFFQRPFNGTLSVVFSQVTVNLLEKSPISSASQA
ncbi:hypothetical protein SNK04_000972 [Fusarium graminearum]